MRTPKGILFDLDNTLVDRHASLRRYAQAFCRDFGNSLGAVTPHVVAQRLVAADCEGHRDKSDFLARIQAWPEWTSRPDVEALNRHWMWEFPPLAVAVEGLNATLDMLVRRDIKLGIITNGSARAQNGKIMALHLWRHFPCILVSESIGLRKPDPEIFTLALDNLDLSPSETWFIGDHPEADIMGADRAGLVGVWITGFHIWPEEHAEPALQVRRLPEIIDLIERN